MPGGLNALELVLLIPAVVGCAYSLVCMGMVVWYLRRPLEPATDSQAWPPVTILKPVHGLEWELEENLRSACELDYPDYQVVMSVQRSDDPALPLLRALEAEYGEGRVTVAVTDTGYEIYGEGARGWNRAGR